jgi:hypothetical protein
MIEEERRRRTRAELEFRNATRKVEAEKAMTDHERTHKAFHENRARLKAERLAREREGQREMKLGPRPNGRPWTPAEDAQLLALLESKMERALIARKLKRTGGAITTRLVVLRDKTK